MSAHDTARRRFLKTLAIGASAPLLLRGEKFPRDSSKTAGREHCIVTANIRVPLPEDEASGNGWSARRKLCAAVIQSRSPDVVCLQEALREPTEHLCADLGQEFREFGFHGPEMDARREGYQLVAKNPILYSVARYDLVSAGGFWLSETPHLPATRSWGSARARHVNWVRLRDRAGREFRVLNTHLDHQSQPARQRQLAMILDEAALYQGKFPQVLAGDFNVDRRNPVFGLLGDAGWKDAYSAVHGDEGDGFTAHAYEGTARRTETGRIDFIFTRGAIAASSAEIIRDAKDGRFPSDHFFVSARVRIA
jgi:endonuclease/exonuclease/phosphatase family metal-dependent hydrolase